MQKEVKSENSYRSFLKLALVIVLILVLGFIFVYTWINSYNVLLRFPYILKGNVFLMVVYMVLSYIFMVLFDCNNLSETRPAYLIFSEFLSIIACNIIVYLVIIIPAAALGLMPIIPIVNMTILDFIVIVIWALCVNSIFKRISPPQKVLLITSKNNVDEIVVKFSKRNDLYSIDDKIAFDDSDLESIYDKCNRYDNILIGDITSEARNDIIKHCFNNSRNIYVIPKISDILLKYSEDILVFDTPLYLSTNFGLSFEVRFFKRLIDIVISLFILIVFFPIWLFVALMIKIEDGGPIFFLQERVTIDNKLFNIIKFRSMKVSDSDEVMPTLEDDDRVTRVGKFIRKYHIDEIPQLLNILVGDMSLVGPRPERKEHVELYTKEISEFEYRSKVKSGLTGLAQIYGKYNTSAIDKLKLDLIYIKKCGFIFDLELILRTLKVLIVKENTEGFDAKTQEYIKNNAK
jgi:exopolysaccharide biosynthesis polyprenyl glycosylphosphotransferase